MFQNGTYCFFLENGLKVLNNISCSPGLFFVSKSANVEGSLQLGQGSKINMEKKSSNSNLHRAAKVKNDEFYTQLTDIERELKYYRSQFKNKVVYCNCDDPFESNFFKYFAGNFNALGLKRLIATSYRPSPIANTQLGLFPADKLLSTSKGRPKITANKFIINE